MTPPARVQEESLARLSRCHQEAILVPVEPAWLSQGGQSDALMGSGYPLPDQVGRCIIGRRNPGAVAEADLMAGRRAPGEDLDRLSLPPPPGSQRRRQYFDHSGDIMRRGQAGSIQSKTGLCIDKEATVDPASLKVG